LWAPAMYLDFRSPHGALAECGSGIPGFRKRSIRATGRRPHTKKGGHKGRPYENRFGDVAQRDTVATLPRFLAQRCAWASAEA
jgi:hypothetical protein